MEKEDIQKKVNDIVYEVLKDRIHYEEITGNKHILEDLEADSSETLEIFLTMMSEFDVDT